MVIESYMYYILLYLQTPTRLLPLAPAFIDQYIFTMLPDTEVDPSSTDLSVPCRCFDTLRLTAGDFDPDSSNFLNLAQHIQDAVVRIRLQDSSTPLDAAQVAPNQTSLEATESDSTVWMMNTLGLTHFC